jgi:uncharacterized protein
VLLVKTYLSSSAIDGFGVFAGQTIEEGTPIWAFNPLIDMLIDDHGFQSLPDIAQAFVTKYAYRHDQLRTYVLCSDDARFMNHSDMPNVRSIYPEGDIHGIDLAARRIAEGEEITCDYATFDPEHFKRLTGAARVSG